MKTQASLTSAQLRQAATLQDSIEAQQRQLTALLSGRSVAFKSSTKGVKVAKPAVKRDANGKRIVSQATKDAIAKAATARWARVHAAKAAGIVLPASVTKNSPPVPTGTPVAATSAS